MEALLEAIFGNFMIIIIIIGGIVGFLKDKSEKGKQQEKQSERPSGAPNPTAAPSAGDYQTSHHQPAEPMRKQTYRPSSNTTSVDGQRAEHMKHIVGRIQVDTDKMLGSIEDKEILRSTVKKSNSGKVKRPYAFKSQIQANLTRDGLVDSIIMAEVLGPPRATKPYRSVIQERKRNQ